MIPWRGFDSRIDNPKQPLSNLEARGHSREVGIVLVATIVAFFVEIFNNNPGDPLVLTFAPLVIDILRRAKAHRVLLKILDVFVPHKR